MLVEINCFIYNVLFFNFFLHIELIKLCMSPFPFDSFLAIIYQAFIIIISHNSPNVAVGFCTLSSGLFALQNEMYGVSVLNGGPLEYDNDGAGAGAGTNNDDDDGDVPSPR